MADAEYHHGDMNVDEQAKTFSGFMRATVWGSGLLAMTLVFLTLHFTFVGLGWFTALGIAFVLGVVIGLALGMKAAWYGTVVGLTVFMGFIGVIAAIVSAILG